MHFTPEQISAYAGGDLPAAETAAIAAHLTSCAECQAVARDMARVRNGVARLGTVPPAHDLWPGIARRLAERAPRQPWWTRRVAIPVPLLAAGALVAVVAGGAAVRAIGRASAPPFRTGTRLTPVVADPSPPVLTALDQSLQPAIRELERLLADRRSDQDSTTRQIITANLQRIDRSIAEIRAALARAPNDGALYHALAEAFQHKIAVLRRYVVNGGTAA